LKLSGSLTVGWMWLSALWRAAASSSSAALHMQALHNCDALLLVAGFAGRVIDVVSGPCACRSFLSLQVQLAPLLSLQVLYPTARLPLVLPLQWLLSSMC
jgi:hypothetical protein